MDIFNRPPAISEDTLHYLLYPPSTQSDRASATTLAAYIASFVETLVSGTQFIWHRDAFEVKVVPRPDQSSGNESWILEGRMRVGDCVDDEWCAVWLLKEISAKWDVVTSVYDSDGEFLLIEAAEALPAWVKPTNSENRVWIHNSRLNLIPLTHISPRSRERRRRKLPGAPDSDDEHEHAGGTDDDAFIAADDAVNLVRDTLSDTFAPAEVEKIVWDRISGYPSALKNHTHTTKAYIPEPIAKALSVNPFLVQRAVETFYTRDATQLRAAHRMVRFPPNTSVLTSVRMSRTAYAQLSGQKFFPPKIFGQWKEREGSNEWRWKDVGMKIAVGFEMLYQESKGRQSAQNLSAEGLKSSAEATKDALRRNPEYQTYIQNLVSANYFKGEREGSDLWKTLEDKAASTFVEVRRSDDATRPSFASQVDTAISHFGLASLPQPLDRGEDSEEWMSIDAEDFDQMLEETLRRGKGQAQPTTSKTNMSSQLDPQAMDVDGTVSLEDRVADEQARRLKDLASKVEEFIEGEGDVEGARFDDEEFSDEPLSDEEEEDHETSDTESSSESDPSPAKDAQRKADRQAAMDKLVPALEPAEYGQMPASFHSNSQRVAPTTIATDVVEEVSASPIKTNVNTNTNTAAAALVASQTLKPPKMPSIDEEPNSNSETNPDVKPKSRPIRPPIIPRDKYDGVDSDDESDVEDEDLNANEDEEEEEEEDRPQVVGDIEIDMGEEEEEFLEFSRHALGITDAMWEEIVKDRKERGAFLPASATNPSPKKSATEKPADAQTKRDKDKAPGQGPRANQTAPRVPRVPEPGPRPNVNPELDSFESVMKALDEVLAQKKQPPGKTASSSAAAKPVPKPKASATKAKATMQGAGKGKQKATVEDALDSEDDEQDEEWDIDAALDAELKHALKTDGPELDEDGMDVDGGMDYNLIKNFLESFKSQAGLAGPVSNLAGRLAPDLKFPRDS